MSINSIARWTVLVPLFILPFLALYVEGSLFFPFISGKNFAFRALVEIALAGWLVLAVADRRYRPHFSLVLASFTLLVAWMAVADALSLNPHKAFWSNFERMDGWVTLVHVYALFLVASSVLTVDKLWRKWWMTFVAATAFVCGYGLLQLFGIAKVHQSTTRLDATLGNSEYFAGFLLLAVAITFWQAMESKGKGLRTALFALVALEVLLLFNTGTRGTFVAFVVAALAGGVLWLVMLGTRGRKGALVFMAAVLVFVGGFYSMRNAAFVQQNENLSRYAAISLGALETRFKIWDMAVAGAKERPLTGWGHEGFNYVFNAHYEPSLHGQEPWFDRAHNIYLDWLIAGGVPALLLFLLLGGSAMVAVYLARDLKAWERVLILSAFIGYGIQGLAVFDNLFTYIPITMLLAYAHTLRSRPIPAFERLREAQGVTLDIAAPLALIMALLLIYMVNIPTYAAGKDLIRGLTPVGTPESRLGHFRKALDREPFATQEIREQLLSFAQAIRQGNSPDEVKAQAIVFASEEIAKEIARAPGDARLHALQASFFRNVGEFELARMAGAKARAFSPNKQSIILEQGMIEWQAGDPAKARAFFDEAYALSTTSDELAVYAAAGRIINKDAAGGKELLEAHFGTTFVTHPILVFAYHEARAWNDLIAVLERRYRELNDPVSGYLLAKAYAQAGRIDEARAHVRNVMSAHPASASEGAALLVELGMR